MLFALCSLLILSSCQKAEGPISAAKDENDPAISQSIRDISLFEPGFVPEHIDSQAVYQALQLECSGIRILKARSTSQEGYFVTYFNQDDETGIVDHSLFWQNGEQVVTSDLEKAFLVNRLENSSLRKTLHDDDDEWCWRLADFFRDANYSGTHYKFTQRATTTGYYHKIIYNLYNNVSCCDSSSNYTGQLYQNISSHKWDNDYNTNPNYRTSVHQIKVWAGVNLVGYNQELTSSKAHADTNWIDEYFDPPGNLISINDEVASLDMMYYVVAK